MKKIILLTLLALMIWLVPFITGFFFYDPSGKLAIDTFLFKSIMLLTLTITCAFAIIIYSKKIELDFLKHYVIAGFYWFSLNIILDLFVLIPITSMPFKEYLFNIGLRYLVIPIISSLCGFILKNN